eukprot:m51a1_g9617 putative sec-c motif domain protein (381) ;mRNA; f:1088777-1090274
MAEAPQVIRSCFNCDKAFTSAPPKVCSRCGIVGYCSTECLKASWKRHQKTCDPNTAAKLLQHVANKAAAKPDAPAPQEAPAAPAAPVVPEAPTKIAATTAQAPAERREGEEEAPQQPIMPCGGSAHVVSDGKALDAKESARLQALAGTARAANMRTFIDLAGERKTLTKDDIDSTATVVFSRCKDCEYTISTLCTKVFVQNCTGCTFIVTGKIVTSTMELYECSGVSVTTQTELHTAQADQCTDLSLDFGAKENIRMVIWAGCENLRVRVATEEGQQELVTGLQQMSAEYQNLRKDIDQFKISLLLGKIVNERVVRLNNGFPTTKREQDEFERRQEENLQKLASQMGITIKRKARDGPKVGRNDPCPCGSGKKFKNCCSS